MKKIDAISQDLLSGKTGIFKTGIFFISGRIRKFY